MWDLDKDPPPEPYKYSPPPKFEHLVRGIDLRGGSVPPPIKQQSLFPTLEDQVLEKIEMLLLKYRSNPPRVRYIAKRFDVDESTARKALEKAKATFVHHLQYEHWLRNKEYFEWYNSKDGRDYLRNLSEWLAGQRAREKADFEHRLQEGLEHVISINTHKKTGLREVLDNPSWADMICSGPITGLISLTGLTENDARILWVNGYMILDIGNEETLFNHKFTTPEELAERAEKNRIQREEDLARRAKCIKCSKILTYNEIGFATKMGQPGFCPECLGADKEYVKSIARHYRSTGCNMFI